MNKDKVNNIENNQTITNNTGLVYFNNLQDLEELNSRIFNRNIPSNSIAPNLSFRPINTKYQLYPDNSELKNQLPVANNNYDIKSTFNPGTDRAPASYNFVNDESLLSNRYFGIQDCPNAYWMPNTNSDLYSNHSIANNNISQELNKSHPYLNQPVNNLGVNIDKFNKLNIGKNILNNSTRVQLRDL